MRIASEKRDWDGMQEIRIWLDEGQERNGYLAVLSINFGTSFLFSTATAFL